MTCVGAYRLVKPVDDNERRRWRRSKQYVEPLAGFFMLGHDWEKLSNDEKYLSKIMALAEMHPDWVFYGVSASALYGASVPLKLQKKIHVCALRYQRKSLPIQVHRLADYSQVKILVCQPIPPTFDTTTVRTAYQPITDSIGRANGVLVTSPLRTMFDVMRDAGFEYGLGMCDATARTVGWKKLGEEHFERLARIIKGAWHKEDVLYMLGFVDGRAENGGESLARAHMIMAGLEVPELQVNMDVKEYRGDAGPGVQMYSIHTYRVDYMWTVADGGGGMRKVAGELDGEEKYSKGMTNVNRERKRDALLAASGVRVVHFSHADGCRGNGGSMTNRLRQAGVQMVSEAEREKRRRILNPQLERVIRSAPELY